MTIGYYVFSLFIFVLVCIIMFLGKYLYSDTKRQNKLLDEKETKLLRLYQTVEESLEEFFDQVGEAKSEIKMLGTLHINQDEITSELPLSQQKARAESGAQSEPTRFQYIFDEFAGEAPPAQDDDSVPASRTDAILALWNEGRQLSQIAEELGITKTEVTLVLGLNGDSGAEQ